MRWLLFIALCIISPLCGWFLSEHLTARSNEALRDQLSLRTLIEAHRMFGPDDGLGLTFPANDFAKLASVVSRDLGTPINPPPDDSGLPVYRGGRILPLGLQPAALLAFERGGDFFTVVIFPQEFGSLPSELVRIVDDTSVRIFPESSLGIAIIGNAGSADVEAVASMLH